MGYFFSSGTPLIQHPPGNSARNPKLPSRSSHYDRPEHRHEASEYQYALPVHGELARYSASVQTSPVTPYGGVIHNRTQKWLRIPPTKWSVYPTPVTFCIGNR